MTQRAKRKGTSGRAWYEFRVWGRHPKARKHLARLADDTTTETIEDWYLLSDDPDVNAKIRGNAVKLKELVGERKGFEVWETDRHREPDGAPEPFDEVIAELRLDRGSIDRARLAKALRKLDPSLGVRAVRVRKERVRHTIGDLRTEVTEVKILATGERLRTIVLEGDDLDQLVALRDKLGLSDEENLAVHRVIDRSD